MAAVIHLAKVVPNIKGASCRRQSVARNYGTIYGACVDAHGYGTGMGLAISKRIIEMHGGIKRILVVEDQPDNRQIIRDMLAGTNYEIIEAEDGEQALVAIEKQRPDLILMDIQLPIMDGYTATSRIKADPALRSIPIIAVTSYALSGEEKKARAAGCDDYVPKPFSPRQLLAKIKQYLS